MRDYDNLVIDLQSYTGNTGQKFIEAIPLVISLGQLMTCRAMPLEMFNEVVAFSLTPHSDTIMFSAINPAVDPITVDHLQLQSGHFVERRSRAYVMMHKGRGSPTYFCDIPGGIMIAPKPFRSEVVDMQYLTRPALDSTHKTNWYTENVYDLLLRACLIESSAYLIDQNRKAEFQGDFEQYLAAARRDHQDMLRSNVYIPVAIAAVPAEKGGSV